MSTETIPVAVTLETGPLAILHFVTSDGGGIQREGTDEEIQVEIARAPWLARVVSWRRLDARDIPDDRTFRDAWADRGGGPVGVDMPRAREIQMARIRARRDAELVALDGQQLQHLGRGRGPDVAAIEAQKQVLRDLPATVQPAVDTAATPEALVLIGL